jgi:hypothetical protein
VRTKRKRRRKRRSEAGGGEIEPVEAEVINVLVNEYNQ